MTMHLIVTKPFLGYVRGDIIDDVAKISQILTTGYKRFVVKVGSSATLKG